MFITPVLLLVGAALRGCNAKPAASNTNSSLTFIYQNNLNASDDAFHHGAILLDPMTSADGQAVCASLSETLLSKQTVQQNRNDFGPALAYLAYAKYVDAPVQRFHIGNGTVLLANKNGKLRFQSSKGNAVLPVLCTQSATDNQPGSSTASSQNKVSIVSNDNTFNGFRNLKSFRFQGIPYAGKTGRFEYSGVNQGENQIYNVTEYGPDCAQLYDSNSAEDCLFMNIQTPYIPKSGSKANLRPVLMSIYGGGFTGGNSGPNSGLDTGNLASREDIVGVQFNYRLSTLGFLAVPGTTVRGNFGIGDQITALRWVRQNIANFGGDPDKVTIIGESAGAGSVRALLGSPIVIEENLIAGGVAQSNLGGGKTLGLSGDYGTTYSSYYTVDQSYAIAGQQIFKGVGCNQKKLSAQIKCLKKVPWQQIQGLSDVARYVVQDGDIVDTPELEVGKSNGSVANVNVIFGTTANDGASFSSFPTNTTSKAAGIASSLGISEYYANQILDSGLFPYYNTGNLSLDTYNISQRVATDKTFRCIDEATMYAASQTNVFKSVRYYTMERTYEGYDPDNLGPGLTRGPVEPGYPNGDPNLPYFRLHGSDLGFTYGNQYPLRDEQDLIASQVISGYFAQFAKTGNPNPSQAYLQVRDYTQTLQSIKAGGPWDVVDSKTGPTKALDYIARSVNFPDLAQCTWLNYTISYYLTQSDNN